MASRHTGPLMKIVTTYTGMPPSPTLLEALESYIESQMQRACDSSANQLADQVCEHLHDGPAKMGVICRSCYEAEKNASGVMEFESLRVINEKREK